MLGDVGVDADVIRLGYRVLAERAGVVRYEAEQGGASTLVFPSELQHAGQQDSRLAEQLAKERALFTARRDALVGQVSLLRLQRDKIGQELASLKAQIEQAQSSMAHQRSELERNRQLLKEGFISDTRISQLSLGGRLWGEAGRAPFRAARAGQRLVDTDLKIKSLESDYRQQASDQLKIAMLRMSEIQQELRKSTDASQRQDRGARRGGGDEPALHQRGHRIEPAGADRRHRADQSEAAGGGADPPGGHPPGAAGPAGAHPLQRLQLADDAHGGGQGGVRVRGPQRGPPDATALVHGDDRGRPGFAAGRRQHQHAGGHAGRSVHPGRAAHAAGVPGGAGDLLLRRAGRER